MLWLREGPVQIVDARGSYGVEPPFEDQFQLLGGHSKALGHQVSVSRCLSDVLCREDSQKISSSHSVDFIN
ncbi:hypothetical protein [Cryobacterium sp. MDB2-33-2]|uniref:hypothetical protein n=1 Tax=Cryobacterium sp. MDB2-33-2 TaxID=1259179 RepID=UPI00106C5563|nr:hypothetical protein [Cryobacterium sp. MDB2-33-2]TFC11094.1 hypothetical protein E3O59_02170 [Cryobacterium sp. MDB2-33-2]